MSTINFSCDYYFPSNQKTLICSYCGNRLKIDKAIQGIEYCKCKGSTDNAQAVTR